MKPEKIIVPVKLGLAAEYEFFAVKRDGTRRRLGGCHNLITNAGLDQVAQGLYSGLNNRCDVGTGTTPEANTDTALVTRRATTTSVSRATVYAVYEATPVPRMVYTQTSHFDEGAASGNLTEVGVGPGSDANAPLFSRALIRDANNNPTSITVLSDEKLDVVWTLYVYPPADVTGSFNITVDGVVTAFDYLVRPAKLGTGQGSLSGVWDFGGGVQVWIRDFYSQYENTGGGLGAADITDITTANTNQGMGWTGAVKAANYVPGNYYLDITLTRGTGVSGVVKSMWFNTQGAIFQMRFTPTFNLATDHKFVITMRVSWGRYAP